MSSACRPLGGVVLPSQAELQSKTSHVVFDPFGEHVKCVVSSVHISSSNKSYNEMNEGLGGGRMLVNLELQ